MNSKFRELYHADKRRYGKASISVSLKAFHFFLRKAQSAERVVARKFYCLFLNIEAI